MENPLLDATKISVKGIEPYCRFRRALRLNDQLVLDDLFENAQNNLLNNRHANFVIEVLILSLLLEEHKEVLRLRRLVENMNCHPKKEVGLQTNHL